MAGRHSIGVKAGSATGTLYWLWYSKRALVFALAATAAVGLSMTVPLAQAHALFNLVDAANDLFNDMAGGLLSQAYKFIVGLTTTDQLTHGFTELLGPGTSAYAAVESVKKDVIDPIGYSVVAIMAMVQMAKIGSKFDSNGVAVEVREVFFLMLFCVVFFWLIDNSLELCKGFYDMSVSVINSAYAAFDTAGALNGFQEGDFVNCFGFGGSPIVLLMAALLSMLGAFIASIVIWVVTTARYLQIYVFTIFAPIPLALLASDETRQWGTGYIKNYLAVCLAGVIMTVVIALFPALFAGATTMPAGARLFAMLGAVVVYVFALIKAGSWARDILGG